MLAADLNLVDQGLQAGLFLALQVRVDTEVFSNPAALVGQQLQSASVSRFLEPVDALLNSFSLDDTPTREEVAAELRQTFAGFLQTPDVGPDIQIIGSTGDAEILFQFTLGGMSTGQVGLDLALGNDAFLEPLLDFGPFLTTPQAANLTSRR